MDFLTFNAFGEARVKSSSIILTVSAVKSSESIVLNEVDVVDLEENLPIDSNDPVRYLFVSDIATVDRQRIVKRQMAGPTLDDKYQEVIDSAIIAILQKMANLYPN
jgi:hypothetical protein